MINALIISVVPLLLIGVATIVVQVFDIKAHVSRLEERIRGHIILHELLEKDR